ncbi:transcription factor LHW-like [Solanum dulcamara]|uniref:transcription factor LHW-like n=1 Tax=Solanum dulcamara TaxID=45834 RepID=UPI002485151A|nr:transcription factor LHW-like [Solanum dulcamara]XP_055833447.1 transcription factor LHW-like [Solanum dulcamara]
MGYLLKEVLKTLCGVNQWSYAVYWKIGCQNTKLLIWEESYYEPSSFSGIHGISGVENPELSFHDWGVCWGSGEVRNSLLMNQAGERVHLLVNKMMMERQINLVGEGLVGRAAVTGSHQWFHSEGFSRVVHPPEVLKELMGQFSAGIQTIAVVPVLPHGVVQFGSCLHIMENMSFVENVRILISQLGCVPGVLLSDENAAKDPIVNTGTPGYLGSSVFVDCCGSSNTMNSAPVIASCSYQSNSSQTDGFIRQTSSSPAAQVRDRFMQSADATFQASNMTQRIVESHDDYQFHKKIVPEVKAHLSPNNQLINNVIKAEVISTSSNMWSSQNAPLRIPRPPFHQHSSSDSLTVDSGSLSNVSQLNCFAASDPRPNDDLISSYHGNSVFQSTGENELCKRVDGHHRSIPCSNSTADANELSNKISSCTESAGNGLQTTSKLNVGDDLITSHIFDGQNAQFMWDESNGIVENDLFQALGIMLTQNEHPCSTSRSVQEFYGEKHEYVGQSALLENNKYGDSCVQRHSGDDLFDVLGADFKNKLLNGSRNSYQSNGPDSNTLDRFKSNCTSVISQYASATVNQGKSDSGSFSVAGFERILDSIASKPSAKQNLDDDVSCRTTLTNLSSSSALNASSSYGRAGFSSQIQGDVFGKPKTLAKSGANVSRSFRSEKEKTGAYSQSSSIYGSQISSWVEQGRDTKPTSSISTGYSKKPDEMSKTGRKRLKPGENPRPRPKDRQMIQDRVKELREIVPNGAKCSIDALLERTIKHMLFLQSVTKHADKLKQTGESKIISNEGGLLLKDNFEGGATWAYEVGSQSMVCPIIVEDLNQPRQMLVEMLCEERSLFLEIADIIRGMGLTILKGVMETRNDKIWARFAVEADRDVTRMEIFISLVRLLEQTSKGSEESANAIDNDTAMVHSYHQAASIPATGRPCN